MKKLFLGALMLLAALFLCICARPVTVYADWKLATPVTVTTYEELLAVLPSGELTPDTNGTIWIPVAELGADITIRDGEEIASLGCLLIHNGYSLTIEDGGYFEGEFHVDAGSSVYVKDGGEFHTTMGEYCTNEGLISLQN